ncbi:putative MATE family efflux protein [Mobilisporobacter senegalensis]|uniref:Probable multidrug resistance protein NorM n=1 Tax=Mobilisporobacter senegalensis TaxID=1329262 RepID=A0A3N1XI55_9FIRM|nr:MATE family efflux transporter [Mobilisporobacter senegalensis]ROR25821.1 putative MATE family efflux protein [Mobilisporobacter senegalensis]
MENTTTLTEGSIVKTLFKLALPIMGTSFVQMAYNLIDMIWVGKIGTGAVAAVGTAGFLTWLANAFILIPKIGAEVGVAQSTGQNDMKEVKKYVKHSIQMVICLAFIFGFILIVFRNGIIEFFNLGEEEIVRAAIQYLVIVSCGFVFYFINPVFTAIFNGYGDSKTPFIINSIGLITNLILDPLLIMGIGPFPRLEVAGAAIATVISQGIVTFIFIIKARKTKVIFGDIHLFQKPDLFHIQKITKLGLPTALQSGLFSIIGMVLARIISQWGPTPIAVQKVGSQIEAISWMTAGGFQSAMSAFVGQNYGARKWDRVNKGYYTGMIIVSFIGIFASALLFFGARPLFSIFIQEEEAIYFGIQYLKILGISQLFMCIEITTAGAFNGLGKTIPPSIIGILFNVLRIPSALLLASTSLGLNGIWWAISISSVFKGIVLMAWYIILLKNRSYRSS